MAYGANAHMQPFITGEPGKAPAWYLRIASAAVRVPSRLTPIFTVKPAKRGDVHYGARMSFLPDGTLVIGTGDGFNYREQAQKLGSHLGKIVRIHTDGTVPADNPFVGNAKALPEIYSLGHRNVQAAARHPVTGQLWTAEHGARGGDACDMPNRKERASAFPACAG